MAINPESQYPGKVAPANADYPYGSARNVTNPGDGTGYPWEAAGVKDWQGFFQSLLVAANIVPSGTPDKVGASQYLDALRVILKGVKPVENITTLLGSLPNDGDSFIFRSFFSNLKDNKAGVWTYDQTILKTQHNGVDTISLTVPWNGSKGQAYQDFKDGVGETDPSGTGCIRRRYSADKRINSDLSPVFVEQFLTGFHGRGMLTAETDNQVTEQAITTATPAGGSSISVADNSQFEIGGTVTIQHNNGRYWSYFVLSKGTGTIGITPGLLYDAGSESRIERTWYNAAHPGKFYMRQLGQRIALSRGYELSTPNSRILFSQYDSNPNVGRDVITAVAGGVVSYFDELNLGQGVIGKPVEFSIGRTAFIDVTNPGDGGETYLANVNGVTNVVVRFVGMCRSNTAVVVCRVKDEQGRTLTQIPFETGQGQTVPKVYTAPVKLLGDSKRIKLEFVADTLPGASAIIIDQTEIYETTGSLSDTLIQAGDRAPRVVVFGDSWVAGDVGSTPEREPFTYELQNQLPWADIINEGVGGNTVTDLLARFDADVAPHEPDYVIVNTGTNDSYSPSSGTFFPNAVDNFVRDMNDLISRIQQLGAKPIIIGVPGLKEADGAFSAWELNDRAKTYGRYFYKNLSGNTVDAIVERGENANGSFTKFADGTLMVVANVDLDTSVTTGITVPVPFSFDTTEVTPAASMDLKTLTTVNTTTAMQDAFIRMADGNNWIVYFPTAGTATETFGLMAIGRWY